MVTLNPINESSLRRSSPQWARECMYGLLYWLAFLLVLEPGNLFRTFSAGSALTFDHEALRITAAAIIGAAVTPLVMVLARRFPLLGFGNWRHRVTHIFGIATLASGLILISCFLAAWGFESKWRPSLTEVRDQIVCNWLLVAYAVFALSAIAHLVQFRGKVSRKHAAVAPWRIAARIAINNRGRRSYVEFADINWIETQGNYLALHVNSAVHLIRATSAKFETQLDPACFIRIHRRLLVAVNQIEEIRPIGNGDAMVRLKDGSELRASRRYREVIRQQWRGDG